jgi:hypothetical protein
MDKSPGLLKSTIGEAGSSFSVHLPATELTCTRAIDDCPPNSATYISPPVPVFEVVPKPARYDQNME